MAQSASPLEYGMFVMPIHELCDQVGAFGSLVLTAHEWDDAERWQVSQELFAREVVPRFNRAIGASA